MKPTEGNRSKPFLSLRLKVLVFHLAFSIITFLIILFSMISNVRENTYLMLKTDLEQVLEAGAAQVDAEILLELAATGSPNAAGYSDDPRYLSLLETLDKIHQTDPDAWPYLYIPSDNPGEVYFVVDLISIYEPERAAGFMEPYQSNSGFILVGLEEQVFRQVEAYPVQQLRAWADQTNGNWLSRQLEQFADWLTESGIAPISDFGIYEDQFGRWASGYLPIRNSEGEKVAAIGVDIKADLIETIFQEARQQTLKSLAYLAIVPLVFLFGLLRWVVLPVNKLAQVATAISESNSEKHVSFEGFRSVPIQDELDQLANILTQMVEQIRQREQRLQAVIETQNAIILHLSPEGKFTFSNLAYDYLWGDVQVREMADLTGSLFFEEDRQAAMQFILEEVPKIVTHQDVKKHEVRIYDRFQKLRWYQWTVKGIFDQQGNLVEYQAVAQDINELKVIQQKLEKANKRLREISHDLIAAGEQERNELAREVHDDVLNYLSELMMNLNGDVPAAMAAETYRKIADRLRQTVYNLRPPMLVYGLYYGLQDYVDNLTDHLAGRMVVDFDLHDKGAEFSKDINIHLFRIVQQACENAVEHAQAGRIRISGQICSDMAEIIIEDDGCGFAWDHEVYIDEAVSSEHFGLAGIFERASLTGAVVKIISKEGKGTRVEIVWTPEKYKIPRSSLN